MSTAALALLDELTRTDVAFVIEGAAENFLRVPYSDPQLVRTADVTEVLAMHDVMTAAQYTRGHFGLLHYAEATVLAIHAQCKVPYLHESLRWPRAAREVDITRGIP